MILTLLAAATAAITPAPVDEKRAREVHLLWQVVADANVGETITAHKGDLLFKQLLIPIGYATLDADAVDEASGAVIAKAGDDFLFATIGAGTMMCAAKNPLPVLIARYRPGSPYVRACLYKKPGDAAFASFTSYGGQPTSLPAINGRIPKSLHPLKQPVSLTTHDPKGFKSDYFLGLRFYGKAMFTKEPVFVVAWGHVNETASKTGSQINATPTTPDGKSAYQQTGPVTLMGAKLEVTSNAGDTVALRVIQKIPAGVFGLTQPYPMFF